MATRNFVPRADGEGGIGKPSKHWQSGYINELTVEKVTGPTDAQAKFLRGDGTWQTPPNTTYSNMTAATASATGKSGLVPAPAAGAQGKYLRGDGTWNTPTNTTYSNMTAATSSAAGKAGLVPAPAAGAQAKFLRGDGTWQTPTDTNTTYSNMTAATASAAGKAGLVPAPSAGAQEKFLRGDGTWQEVGGIPAIINVTTKPNAVITCTGPAGTQTATANSSGAASFEINKLGSYTLSGTLSGRTSMNNPTVNVDTVATFTATVSFFEATLTVTAETGSEVTLKDGTFTTKKTAASNKATFSVYNAGTATVSATSNGATSNTASITFSTSGESKTATLSFIKLTVKGVNGEAVTVTKGSVSKTATIGTSKSAVIYLPSTGTWTAVGVYSKNSQSVTKTKTVSVTAYTDYSVGLASTIFGMRIDGTKSDPAQMITYLSDCDNAGFTPAKMNYSADTFDYGSWENAFFMPKPCMLKYDGTVDYYLNPNDYTKKADGTASDVANTSYGGNAMIEWGDGENQIWVKVVPDNGTADTSCRIYISDSQEDSNYHAWSFINNQGKLVKHFYTPIYNGSYISSKMRSLSGQTCGISQNATTEIAYAKANNTTSNVLWYTEVYSDITLINMLLMLIGRNMDTQAVFGEGITGASSATATGTLNTKGMFYGKATSSSKTTAVKVFGMENWWGNVWRRYAGHVTNSNGQECYKLTYGTQDGTTATEYNTTGSGYKVTANNVGSGYVTKVQYGTDGNMCTNATSGSASTYYCDYYYHSTSCYALRGGYWYYRSYCGAFYVDLDYAASYSNSYDGCALSCKPLA